MPRWLRALGVLVVLCGVAWPRSAWADPSIVQQEERHLYHEVPDVTFKVAGGQQLRLSDLWDEQPVLITLFYQRCVGTCSPFLRSLGGAIDDIGGLGETYKAVSLSFDPADTVERVDGLARSLKIGKPGEWYVGVAAPEDVQRLTQAIGFWYKAIPESDQFDHPALVAAVYRGKIMRVLLGNTVSRPRFRELVLEMQGKFVPMYETPNADTRFRCVDVNPDTGELTVGWGMLILGLPAMLSLVIAGAVVVMTRRGRVDDVSSSQSTAEAIGA